jgi:hypothetical protein
VPIIAKITSAAAGEIVTDINALALPRPIMAAAKPTEVRPTVYVIPREQLAVLQRAGIEPGMAIGEIDRRLQQAGIGISDRIAAKSCMRSMGLLR